MVPLITLPLNNYAYVFLLFFFENQVSWKEEFWNIMDTVS